MKLDAGGKDVKLDAGRKDMYQGGHLPLLRITYDTMLKYFDGNGRRKKSYECLDILMLCGFSATDQNNYSKYSSKF